MHVCVPLPHGKGYEASFWQPITEIQRTPYFGSVYSLSVEDPHTYVADGIVTHNCMDGWNESSRRYVTMEPEFYIPQAGDWRSTPEDKKQGSGDFVPSEEGKHYTADLIFHIEKGEELYQEAMDRGIAAEQAR